MLNIARPISLGIKECLLQNRYGDLQNKNPAAQRGNH